MAPLITTSTNTMSVPVTLEDCVCKGKKKHPQVCPLFIEIYSLSHGTHTHNNLITDLLLWLLMNYSDAGEQPWTQTEYTAGAQSEAFRWDKTPLSSQHGGSVRWGLRVMWVTGGVAGI